MHATNKTSSTLSFSTAPLLLPGAAWAPSAGLMRLCFFLQISTALLSQSNNVLYSFLHALIAFYEQAG